MMLKLQVFRLRNYLDFHNMKSRTVLEQDFSLHGKCENANNKQIL